MCPGVKNITVRYEGKEVFKDFSLEFRDNAVTCIMGPSGCGKTTLLNVLSGILAPDSGEVTGMAGRRVSFAFQESRLLPWKSVAGNVDFVLDRSLSETERSERVAKWLDAVCLGDAASLWPSQLSGGMARRASLSRALAPEADILLLDEPFTGIDRELKEKIMKNLKEVWDRNHTTVIMVTHDKEEADALADLVLDLQAQ
ncbi:MAG: ABC transporter ATP-binding protein [Bacteroidales bacterium]|nr:ABC transporter ATP-binding protein [Bacteroidales bacterium]MBR5056465.1 ABC transporter ATP-binding protein [Bacteroidales bacterium]